MHPKHQALPSSFSNLENNQENRKKAWFFLVPEGRFSGGQEGDSWWDENIFCSRLTQTHPSVRVKKNIKNMKQSQMNFKEIRLVLLLFLSLSPKHASQFQALPSSFFNLENNRESKKKTWFIRLRWEDG